MWLILLNLIVLVYVARCDDSYSISISETDDYYATISLDVGTPEQSFTVFLDTTNEYSWVLSNDTKLSTDQDGFVESASSTWTSSSSTFSYTYENGTTNGTLGEDTLVIGSLNLTSEDIGVADYNQELFEDEEISGALSVRRTSTLVTSISGNDDIEAVFTIDIDSKKFHVGEYVGSYDNTTELSCETSESDVSDYWSFSIDTFAATDISSLLSCSSGSCYGAIDSASPYLTFACSSTNFQSLWSNIGGSSNCDYSTLECDEESDIKSYLYFTVGNYTYYMERSDYYYDDKLHIQKMDQIGSIDYVVFFGRPFLKTVDVTLDARNDTISVHYTSTSSSSSEKWLTVLIVAICVIAFALIFFGIFFWKFKIPAPRPGQGTREEQALLGGQPPRAQQHQPLGQPAQPSAPVQPGPQTGPAQAVGSTTGASRTDDPDEIRRRRLQFLESQQNQDQE